MVAPVGLEPTTKSLKGFCYYQLSYKAIKIVLKNYYLLLFYRNDPNVAGNAGSCIWQPDVKVITITINANIVCFIIFFINLSYHDFFFCQLSISFFRRWPPLVKGQGSSAIRRCSRGVLLPPCWKNEYLLLLYLTTKFSKINFFFQEVLR